MDLRAKLFLFVSAFFFLSLSVFAEPQPWDFLRPIVSMASAYDFFTSLIVLVLALAILFISAKAYFKAKTSRLLFVSIAFGLIALKWLLVVSDFFFSPGLFFSLPAQNVFELLILASLFYAFFVK